MPDPFFFINFNSPGTGAPPGVFYIDGIDLSSVTTMVQVSKEMEVLTGSDLAVVSATFLVREGRITVDGRAVFDSGWVTK